MGIITSALPDVFKTPGMYHKDRLLLIGGLHFTTNLHFLKMVWPRVKI